jgi:DNA-binding PadR family transcriptional regulator
METIKGDILRGHTSTLVLSLLAEQPTYGLHISKEINRRSKGTFRFREALFYPALHQLEKDKLVESDWRSSTHGHRRRYYKLTAKGKKEVERLRKRWKSFSKAIDRVLTAS